MTIDDINMMPEAEALSEFHRCCGSSRWVSGMAARRPFHSSEEILKAADQIWASLTSVDWKEAFVHHPKIGDLNGLRTKFKSTGHWAEREQSGMKAASEEVLLRLAEGNRHYEEKFGYIFIVCATGKSAKQMLEMLQARLDNDPEKEIRIASEEQRKITAIRLEKLLSS